MLEVVFSDSEKGSMSLAKNYNAEAMSGGVIGYIGEKPAGAELEKYPEKNLEKQYQGQAIGKSPRDVVNIGFMLDVGDISGDIDGNERRSVFCKLWGRFNFDLKEQERFFEDQRQDMEKLLSAAKGGTPIRIWKSDAPYSACGFYYVCNILRDIDCSITVVSLPGFYSILGDGITEYSHWGEVGADKIYRFLPLEKQLTRTEKKIISDYWRNLMAENAPLRAVINGKAVSVPEDFYDFIILNNLPDNDFIMARFIGTLLGKYRIGVSDSWYAYRIEKMVEENKLIIVGNKDPLNPYGKVLRKAQ